jgi:hypothetical protein
LEMVVSIRFAQNLPQGEVDYKNIRCWRDLPTVPRRWDAGETYWLRQDEMRCWRDLLTAPRRWHAGETYWLRQQDEILKKTTDCAKKIRCWRVLPTAPKRLDTDLLTEFVQGVSKSGSVENFVCYSSSNLLKC